MAPMVPVVGVALTMSCKPRISLPDWLPQMLSEQQAAREAVCPRCATYGRLDLASNEPQPQRMDVRCRSCSNVWSMSDAGDD